MIVMDIQKLTINRKIYNVRWEQIKTILRARGYLLTDLAQLHGVSPSCFMSVKTKPYPKIERIIAEYLQTNPWDLWPERYDENGKPNRINRWYLRGSRKREGITNHDNNTTESATK